MEEEQDPQDTAVLSNDMAEPKVEQRKIEVKSVYAGLVEIAKTHGKLYRTNGKRADMIRFDLTAHSAFVGHAFIVHHGRLRMAALETAAARVALEGLPWLTPEERELDPVALFRAHYLSRPNGSEKYMASNFPAKDIDEMSDDEIAQGEPRGEARVRLEAWMLCAGIDGTLEKYVKSRPGWTEGSWWWSPAPEGQAGTQLVIRTDWWRRDEPIPMLQPAEPLGSGCTICGAGGNVVARIPAGVDDATARAMQVAAQLAKASQTLASEALRLEMRARCFDIDPIAGEVGRLVEYINTGRMRQAWPSPGRDAGKTETK